MNSEWLILGPAALYMMSMTLTPGPNNVMLTASGANFGFRRTMPHMLGILGGCFLLFAGIALGLGVLFEPLSGGPDHTSLGRQRLPTLSCLEKSPVPHHPTSAARRKVTP